MKALVSFEPSGKAALVESGITVLEAARQAGVSIRAVCGGRTGCSTCAIRIVSGSLQEPTKTEQGFLKAPGIRLACLAKVSGDVRVRPVVVERAAVTSSTLVEGERCRLALDLGTSSLKLAVAARSSGAVRASAEVSSPLQSWGGDVLSRLSYSLESEKKRDELRDALQLGIINLLKEVEVPLGAIDEFLIAANTVMAGLLTGADLSSLAHAPFSTPSSSTLEAGPLFELLQTQAPATKTVVLSPLSHFVGGDMRALLHADELKDYSLYLDIGTNVEAALRVKNKLYLASAPAGSAFAFGGQLGSGSLETIEKLLRSGALAPDGSLKDHYRVTRGEDNILRASIDGQEISQTEIRELQLAKTAINVLVEGILKYAKLKPKKLKSLKITGSFGNSLSFETFFSLGIIPQSLEHTEQSYLDRGVLSGLLKLDINQANSLLESQFEIISVDLLEDESFSAALMNNLPFH